MTKFIIAYYLSQFVASPILEFSLNLYKNDFNIL